MKVIKIPTKPYIIEMTAEIDLSDRDNIRDRLDEIKTFWKMLDRIWQHMPPGPKGRRPDHETHRPTTMG